MVERICKQCGKPFSKYLNPCAIKKGMGIFCSYSCSSVYRLTGRTLSEVTKKKISKALYKGGNKESNKRELIKANMDTQNLGCKYIKNQCLGRGLLPTEQHIIEVAESILAFRLIKAISTARGEKNG